MRARRPRSYRREVRAPSNLNRALARPHNRFQSGAAPAGTLLRRRRPRRRRNARLFPRWKRSPQGLACVEMLVDTPIGGRWLPLYA
jgi:hypothetical protein